MYAIAILPRLYSSAVVRYANSKFYQHFRQLGFGNSTGVSENVIYFSLPLDCVCLSLPPRIFPLSLSLFFLSSFFPAQKFPASDENFPGTRFPCYRLFPATRSANIARKMKLHFPYINCKMKKKTSIRFSPETGILVSAFHYKPTILCSL